MGSRTKLLPLRQLVSTDLDIDIAIVKCEPRNVVILRDNETVDDIGLGISSESIIKVLALLKLKQESVILIETYKGTDRMDRVQTRIVDGQLIADRWTIVPETFRNQIAESPNATPIKMSM